MNNKPAILGGTPLLNEEAAIARPSIADYTTPELLEQLKGILDSNMVTNGPTVRELEKAAAEYLDVEHVVAVSSCNLGQIIAIRSANLQGKKAILPSFTLAATANAALWNNCQIEFVDIDLDTYNVSTDHLEELMDEEVGRIWTARGI